MELLKKKWNHSSYEDTEKIRRFCDEWKMHPLVVYILLSRGFNSQKEIQSFPTEDFITWLTKSSSVSVSKNFSALLASDNAT